MLSTVLLVLQGFLVGYILKDMFDAVTTEFITIIVANALLVVFYGVARKHDL